MATSLRDMVECKGGFAAFFRLEPRSPTEVERFIKEWPTVAARIGLTVEPEAPRLFEPGPTYYQKASDGRGLGQDIFREMVDRHSRNLEAEVEADRVKSVFVLDKTYQDLWPRAKMSDLYPDMYHPRPTRAIAVVTLLGRENATIATVEKLPSV